MHAERCNGPAGWRQSGSCVPLECCFDPDWRVAAYAQAATRPCTPEDRAQAEALARQPLDGWRWIRCQSTPPVAR